jgi:hypothetical protein
MNEEFLQYIWKHRLYKSDGIRTAQGEPLTVINPGVWNKDAGPDFFNASVKIGATLWAGNIEIHKKSSDWLKHRHHEDAAFNNVILHVVIDNDVPVKLPNGECLAVFIPQIDQRAWDNYHELIKAPQWPACSHYIRQFDRLYQTATLHAAVVERLQHKTEAIGRIMAETKNDWNETFYRFLARGFGFKTNALPFELLAKNTPLKILTKHKKNLTEIEALLFGQSGLLNEQLLGDDYFLELRRQYGFLASKYQLKGIEAHLWKFLRLRPANFPTIRIAQFAQLICQSESLMSKITGTDSLGEIKKLFQVKASTYWDTHYKFNTPSRKKIKHLGDTACNNLIINSIVPLLFLYGNHTNKNKLMDKALQLLEGLPPEDNQIIDRWKELSVDVQNAFDSQALIELKNRYCDLKRCLHCQLGSKVIAG